MIYDLIVIAVVVISALGMLIPVVAGSRSRERD